jgi:acetylornithine deacetylase/succinyl-diaminopimelate desuccinylase-like protein
MIKKVLFFSSLFLTAILSAQKETAIKSKVANSINELRDFISIPNDALNASDIEDNIFWLKKKFNQRGFNTMELETENHPLFFATLPMQEGKPTVLIYMHFDGQSVDPSKWNQPNPYTTVLKKPTENGFETVPFKALKDSINYNWRLFGRSTSDDKGPIVMLLNAIDLLKEEAKVLPFNVKVILDGEEEKQQTLTKGCKRIS